MLFGQKVNQPFPSINQHLAALHSLKHQHQDLLDRRPFKWCLVSHYPGNSHTLQIRLRASLLLHFPLQNLIKDWRSLIPLRPSCGGTVPIDH